jgi:beta-lactamase class A
VGKSYGKAPAFERDPLHHISQGATPMQVARFYYLLETDRLVNPRLTAEMKEVMSKPGIHHKFVKGLAGRKATIYRKSGTWHQWHADSMLVETPRGRYILVALADDPHGGQWMVRLAPAVHDRLFPPVNANDTSSAATTAAR